MRPKTSKEYKTGVLLLANKFVCDYDLLMFRDRHQELEYVFQIWSEVTIETRDACLRSDVWKKVIEILSQRRRKNGGSI